MNFISRAIERLAAELGAEKLSREHPTWFQSLGYRIERGEDVGLDTIGYEAFLKVWRRSGYYSGCDRKYSSI